MRLRSPTPHAQASALWIGYLSQNVRSSQVNVEDNLMAILELLPISKAERKERLEMLLEELGIAHVRHLKGQLSPGRVVVRRLPGRWCWSLQSSCWTSPSQGWIRLLLQTFRRPSATARRNIGVLITDHNVRETFGIIDRGYIMNEGMLSVMNTGRIVER